MNKITFTNLCMAIYCLFTANMYAQDGYTYTLIDNGSYSFTIGAVPNASASNFATSVQSYGFTILLPDGATATVTSSLGSAANATFFNGTDVAQPTIDGYLITETLGSPAALPAPSAGTTTPIVTIQINGAPTSGILEILANDSALANAVTPLKSFMQADMIDNGAAVFTNVVDPNASGLSGVSSFDFSTLSVEENQLTNLSIYPNPATDVVNIQNSEVALQKVEIYSMNGQLVRSQHNNLERIQVNTLKSGLYIMKLYAANTSKTIKLIRQ
ncbi:T9SS type A sorting domain-containing protein [Kordia sp. YSTF-M3]|uniref:T9SS type A sorting domain-containing protein n=2 Tax=Kordia aestuariivivens TaxID=2759037 RepID=A0ABR7QFT6_9FLAO|nr:T9SS type A sorting domain-containing protein [Kordia aestuariivivens]